MPRTGAGDAAAAARGAQLEREFAFGVVRQLLEPPLADAPTSQRAEYFEGAAGVAAGLLGLPGAVATAPGSPSGPDPPFAVLHGLYWLCANLAPPAGLPRRRRRALGGFAFAAVPRVLAPRLEGLRGR